MAQFLIKYSSTSGVVPTSAELPIRQIAVNTADGKLFIKKNDGTILTFENASAFARAVHTHSISDVTGLQSALDTLTSAAAAAQSGADASLKSASNLSDIANTATARTNLGVDSSSEVDSKISTSKSASDAYTDAAIAALINGSPATLDTLKEIADALAAGEDVATALTNSIAAVSSRVDTLEGQNLDSRVSAAQSAADAAQSTADSAASAASAAQSTADSAVSAAATAQSAADAAQSTADSAVSAAAAAQSGADASVKKAANLSDLADAATSRSNLGVDSSSEVDTKVSNAVSSAQSTLQGNIDGVSDRVTTLEEQNLDSRLSSAENTISSLGSMAYQDAGNVNISGGTFGAGTAPTDSGVILTENSIIDGGTFSGFNGGGGGGGSTPWYADSSSAARTVTLGGTVSNGDEGGGVKTALFSNGTLTGSMSDLSAAPFTVEMFVNPNATGDQTLINFGTGSTPAGAHIALSSSGAIIIGDGVSQNALSTAIYSTGAWTHFAFCYDGSTGFNVYKNGIFQDFVSVQMAAGSSAFSIGNYFGGASAPFAGSITGVRVVSGSQLYTSDFSPTALLSGVSGTELLLNFGATSAPTV